MDDGDGLVKLLALWGYRRGRLDFLLYCCMLLRRVVFVHVRVAGPRRPPCGTVRSTRPVRDVVSSSGSGRD